MLSMQWQDGAWVWSMIFSDSKPKNLPFPCCFLRALLWGGSEEKASWMQDAVQWCLNECYFISLMQSFQPLEILQRQIAAICDLFITTTPRLSSHVCAHCGSLMRDGRTTLQFGSPVPSDPPRHASNIDADDASEILDAFLLVKLHASGCVCFF